MKTVFIAKTERLLCDAICSYCTSVGLKVVGRSSNGKEALDLIQRLNPDFAIIEAELPVISGFEVISRLNDTKLLIHTILYLENNNPDHLRKALSLKLNSSFRFSEDSIEELRKCFSKMASPSFLIDRKIKSFLKEVDQEEDIRRDRLVSLTPTQLKVLSLVGAHKTMPEIAQKLFISPHTVNNHIANIRRKLDLHGRGVVLKYALDIKHRLVDIDGKIMVTQNSYKYS